MASPLKIMSVSSIAPALKLLTARGKQKAPSWPLDNEEIKTIKRNDVETKDVQFGSFASFKVLIA